MVQWKHRINSSDVDTVETLSALPTGNSGFTVWGLGVGLAAWPVVYGVICLCRGHTTLFARRGPGVVLSGPAGGWLAIAYMAIGAFLHFHFFWGASERLWLFSQSAKIVSIVVFLASFGYAIKLQFF